MSNSPSGDAPLTIGVVGCGTISDVYLRNCQGLPGLSVVACADIVPERARDRATAHGVARACTVEELLGDPAIEAVLNLTIPAAHAEITLRALENGKHVYSEKPLAITREDGAAILELARRSGLRVGCAPDTFLGTALQRARAIIDAGDIGEPVGCSATFHNSGPESWHPNPEFLYQPGAGPMFDIGPYYLTALIALLGPISRVTGSARITRKERLIGSEPLRGTTISVRTPTYLAGVLDFAGGPVGTITTSFDVHAHSSVPGEIYGTEGTLRLSDPNLFVDRIALWRNGGWVEFGHMPEHKYAPSVNWRGLGLADMAHAIRAGTPHRVSGEMAFHVLDVINAIHEASLQNAHIEVGSSCERPDPLPEALLTYWPGSESAEDALSRAREATPIS